MNIVTAKYRYDKLTNQKISIEVVLDDSSKLSIPMSAGNRHYQAIQEWIAEGNTVIDNGGGE